MRQCYDSLAGQVDHMFIIRNGGWRDTWPDGPRLTIVDFHSGRKLPIHEWWNTGIDAAAKYAADNCVTKWNTLIVNDDVIAEPDAVMVLAKAMRDSTADMVSPPRPGWVADKEILLLKDAFPNLGGALWVCGWFFMLRGETGLHADTRLFWWYGDNDLEWQARYGGGTLIVPGSNVVNQHPNVYAQDMSIEIMADGKLFKEKWPQAQLS